MSKITLEPNSSGAGTFSIVSPDSNTNRTLNLPDASGNIIAADSSTGRFDSSNMPAGSVIQVVQTIDDGAEAFSLDGTFADYTGITTSITPTSSSNKVLIKVVMYFGITNNGDNPFPVMKIHRDGSDLSIAKGETSADRREVSGGGGLIELRSGLNCVVSDILDSPNTTNTITYSIQVSGFDNRTFLIGATGEGDSISGASVVSTMTLMEIAG